MADLKEVEALVDRVAALALKSGTPQGATAYVDARAALLSAIRHLLEGAEADAALWRKLKPLYYSAHFYPKEMDLPPGVALVFMAPEGTRVSADLDGTVAAIDAARKEG